ncbi:NAD-dependent epimerase/dehydratase family protein [Luedemannella flava]|uniref:NAD-dependent epimerase/dehydratase family protein n=1 Tax=Luedemannella flava TaxID=349316 RepID=A0ABN2ME13_9ACTN
MRLAVTGAGGFLGWHVRVLARALGWPEPVAVARAELADPAAVAARLDGADRLVHLAGVNRSGDGRIAHDNVALARAVGRGLRRCAAPPKTVVYANSLHAGNGTPYGDAKAAAAAVLAEACVDVDFVDLRMPRVYGEHGRPFGASVVATVCYQLAHDAVPTVPPDQVHELAHATDAAAALVDAGPGGCWDTRMPVLRLTGHELAERLTAMARTYRLGEIPALTDRHDVRLFNTYRSMCFPRRYPMPLVRHADARGDLVELVRSHGGAGQAFCSTSRPGVVRGEHFHLAKVERFAVLRGTGEIALRRVGERGVVRFAVSGDHPVVVDMPSMWAHRITNTGPDELLTAFWANEIYDPSQPDTYPEPVGPAPAVAA